MADLQQTIEDLATTVMGYIKNAAVLEVTTKGQVIVNGVEEDRLIARTVLKLDADAEYTIPVREEGGRLVPESDLLALHERSVQAATEYRARILGALTEAVGTLIRPGS